MGHKLCTRCRRAGLPSGSRSRNHQLGVLDSGMPESATGTGGQSSAGNGGQSSIIPDSGADAGCDVCAVKAALVHRYSFDGTGTQARDSVGNAHGTVVGTSLSGSGTVVLSSSAQYVDLPNGIVSSLTNATFETWLSWNGGQPWQRIFDFGSSDATTEGTQGTGVTYLFLTPEADNTSGYPRLIYSTSGIQGETRLSATSAMAANAMTQVAVVFNASAHTLSIYLNGVQNVSGSITGALSDLNDINNWLGHSQFAVDPSFSGTFTEFRIYDSALSPAQLKLTNSLGPDASL